MTVVRVIRPQRWTTIDRRPVNHAALSYRARGVLVWLLDKPDDSTVSAREIAQHGTEGRDAIETALTELRTHGYLVTHKYRDEKGQWATENWLYEHPELVTDTGPGNPARSGPWLSGTDNQGLKPKSTTPEDCADQVVAESHQGAAAVRAALRSAQPPHTGDIH